MNMAITLHQIITVTLLMGITFVTYVNSETKCRQRYEAEENEDLLFMELDDTTELFSKPNMDKWIPVELTNTGYDPLPLLLLIQETYPLQRIEWDIHVELVHSLSHSKITLEPNTTETVLVHLKIPDFVPPRFRSKVTLTARLDVAKANGYLMEWKGTKLSFFFTVVENSLHQYDSIPPSCSQILFHRKEVCPPTFQESHCGGQEVWRGALSVRDGGSGLSSVRITWPAEVETPLVCDRFTYGTTESVSFSMTENCCTPGVEIEVVDLAGNKGRCSIGDVPSSAVINRPICMLGFLVGLCRKYLY